MTGSTKVKINSIILLSPCDAFATNVCTTERILDVTLKILPVSFNWQPFACECSDVCAAESTNGAAQFHVVGQIWSSLAWHLMLWGLNAHNLWSEASNQLPHQPPPPPPSFSVKSSNLQSSCSSRTAVGVRDTRSLHTVTKGRWANV